MSEENRIVGAMAHTERGRSTHTLRTENGMLVRVSPDLYRQVTEFKQPMYLHMHLSSEPTDGQIVVCADVIELEARLAKVKQEAAELANKLSEMAS